MAQGFPQCKTLANRSGPFQHPSDNPPSAGIEWATSRTGRILNRVGIQLRTRIAADPRIRRLRQRFHVEWGRAELPTPTRRFNEDVSEGRVRLKGAARECRE
jgi:hypothetical protein